MPKPKYNQAGAGTQTAALSAGGYNFTDNAGQPSIEYDGTSWGSSAPLRSGSNAYAAGFGTQTAAAIGGGYTGPTGSLAQTEEYNGSTWSTQNNMNTARFQGGSGGAGTQTAGLIAGGTVDPPRSSAVEEYDGTSWATATGLPSAKGDAAVFGIQTAAISMGGITNTPSILSETLLYDGTSWTSGNNFFRFNFGSDGAGTQTAGLVCGGTTSPNGSPPYSTAPTSGGMTAEWNGTGWVSTAQLSNFRQQASMGKNGTNSAGIVFGGNNGTAPGSFSATEEYTGGTAITTASTLTTS
jgi:hypothetical protein